jgi:nucleotidyltransferase substrate binding protein (TIGR01987 family)
MSVDTQWKQRADNFGRVVVLLSDALKNGPNSLNDLEKEGTVKRFDLAVELAWKSLKDVLEHAGLKIIPVTPNAVIKAAFAARLIPDGQVWIDMLETRNLFAIKYDEAALTAGLREISARYVPAIEQLHASFREHSP